jgi:hypothetical protein
MKIPPTLLLFVAGGLLAAEPSAQPVPEAFGFSLVPNAFSSNPRLSMTVFTEMTDHGRELPQASAESPVYFISYDAGRKSEGEPIGEKVFPAPDALQDILFRSLANNGYRPAAPGQTPSLALIYYWGSHSSIEDPEEIALFPERNQQHVLERAMLVGGSAYRRKIADEYAFGYTFADRMPKQAFLIDQASRDMYFVVVSAYDHAEMLAGRRRLAWRTTMTVSANGVSMRDALPPLVLTAADYFGRATDEPVAINRRARRGTVTLGPLQIITDEGPKTPAHDK